MSSLKFFGLPIKEKGYKIVNSRGYLTYSRSMQAWAKEYDKSKYMALSEDLGEQLEALFEEGYVVGIHQLINRLSLEEVNECFKKGFCTLKNVEDLPDINLDFELTNLFPMFMGQLKTSNRQVLLTKIPEDYIGYAINKEDILPIYKKRNNDYYLLPEYIYGVLDCRKDFVCMEDFIKNNGYKNIHGYEDCELVYDASVSSEMVK